MKKGSVISRVNTDQKVISITFDDGPHPDYTPAILDILDENEARCTFFMAGEFIEKYPELVTEVHRRSHEIGNHTRNHPDLCELGKEEIMDEMNWPHQEIFRLTKKHPSLFRPPYGHYNETVLLLCRHFNYDLALWSEGLEMFDWELPGADVLVQTLLGHVFPGAIVLLHDYGGDRSQTVEAVRLALPILKQRGYRFFSLSQLRALQTKEVNRG